MLIIPAIDIKDGAVVRLLQGKFDKKTVYSKDPLKTAKHWQKQGASVIHIVDLDGANSGQSVNLPIVKEIVKNTEVKIEFGGGLRSLRAIEAILDAGIWRVVLGTRAAEDKEFLKGAFSNFKDKVIVSVDAKDGEVLTRGWEKHSGITVLDFVAQLKAIGFKNLIFTDTSKDGMLKGPNLKAVKELLKKSGLKIVASGGITALSDLVKLRALEKDGVEAVIIGKALYEGKFTLQQALRSQK
ncbi:MAG: 1-(5-phosphoribosyl)-5-[(5-phosphoribosylamino)methylideneamino]imidazole-4-carboxamide isomerase [Candidatus Omnitrophica bacterium]|jgi:phosphoribosylformimino-5-aminoimidazole carboxamide ribotide isomerase|nr:1-(5-phosphoribosyl)-5-[(5-phosphoribosylamino)methylideneamino]imidazole-4-carboxamide isomerase [Candidatus Omnitrophota bacterium]